MSTHKSYEDLLISKLKEGNKQAFELLYEKYSGKLYNSISLMLYDKDLAKDITQSTFLTIWEKRSLLDSRKNFSAYLYTIARNLVYKETERLILKNKYIESGKEEISMFENSTIEDDLNSRYIENKIRELIDDLPEVPKEIFTLKREENLSNKEIAFRLNVTERAVEAHFYRTLKYLKENLQNFISLFLF